MTREAIEYFKFHRKIFCEDHLKICPKDSIAYQATLKEKEFYDMAIKALEQEPRKGHWIVDVHTIRAFGSKNETHDYRVHCDKCNYIWDYTTDKGGSLVSNFCPNCGADMREVKE